MIKLKYILIIAPVIFLLSCRKTKLENEYSILVGEWEWIETINGGDCDGAPTTPYVIHSPSMDGFTYVLKFESEGKLYINSSKRKEEKYRLTSGEIHHQYSGTDFGFNLQRKKGKWVNFFYYSNSNGEFIRTYHYPDEFLNGYDGCNDIHSVFKKK